MENFSLSDIAAVLGGRDRNDGIFGGGSGMIIVIILVLFFLMMGRGAWGGNPANFDNLATRGEVQMGFDQQTTTSKLDQIAYGLANSGYTTAQQINGVNTEILRGFGDLGARMDSCCCGIERAIDGVNYTGSINTRDIIQAQERGTQRVLDYLCAQETQRLRDEGMKSYISSQLCGVVRYPNSTTYNAENPFFRGCGCGNF